MHPDSFSNDSGSILRISESILSLVFNQMCDNAEFSAASNSSFIKFGKVEVNHKDIHALHYTGCAVIDARFV